MNKKITAIVIDDEKNGRENLSSSLSKYCSEVIVVAEADSVISGIEVIQKYLPELVFLDIEMPGGNGFKVLEFFRQPSFHVVFVTAYDQYAIQAIRFSALDYILKPINVMDLRAAIDRFRENRTNDRRLMSQYVQNADSPLAEKKLALATGDRIEFCKIGSIIRCQSDGNYTNFYFADGSELLVSKTLNDFDDILEGYGFIRPHKAHLVNLMFVRSFHKNDGGYIKLSNDQQIPVSRRRKDDILNQLKHL